MTGKTRRPCRHRPLHGGFWGALARPAFTMIELLVVIAIFVLLLALAVPAFSSMLYSSEQALAANSLATGLSAARDAALRSPVGTDAAAVFVFEPGGRVSIVPCVEAGGVWENLDEQDPPKLDKRDCFVPVPTMEPVQLPRNWMVRAYAPPNSIDNEWYEKTYPLSVRDEGNWVFPETGFYDTSSNNAAQMAMDGADRQTFMVRFEGGTGKLNLGDRRAALVLLPSPAVFRLSVSPFSGAGLQVDREPDQARFVRRVTSSATLTTFDKIDLLGDDSSDTVLAKPVQQLAVYSEPRLAAGIFARVHADTNAIYAPPAAPDYEPQMVLPGLTPTPIDTDDVNQWIEGRFAPGGVLMPTDARVFSVQHYLGTLQELTGSRP